MRRLCLGLPVRVVVALALLPACSGSPTISSAGTPTSLGALPPPAGPSTPVREVRMRRLVLTADLSEAPARWRLVATIPFGASPQELGLVTDVHRTPIPDLPRSFAIGPDRSIWILDVVKRRVAHYSSDAAFLGAIGGFKFDRFSPHPRDMTFSGGQMFVLEEHHRESNVVTVDSTGTLHRVRPRVGNGEIGVLLLYPSVSGVAGLVVDQVQNADRPPRHFARFDPGSGAGVALPGVPVGEGRWIDLDAPSDADLDVTFTTTGRAAIQPIYIRAVTAIGPSGKGVEIVSGPRIESVTEGGVAIVVPISPARPGDADRYGGGVWLLRLGVDGKPLLWERLPAPGISDEEQVRRIATGPDGRLYLMVPTSEGEQIYAM